MTRKKTFLITLLLALLTLPFLAAQAQSDTTISIGDSISGELTADALSASYSIELKTGDAVSITLTSDEFDSYLSFSAPDAPVITDDDSAGGKNALIDYAVKVDGVYIIRVDSYNQVSTGAYTLTVERDSNVISASPAVEATPAAVETVAPENGSIAYGESVEGAITADQNSVPYTFSSQANDHVVITLTSSDFDAYLTLQDASGSNLTTDDDSAGSLNARIEYTLPAQGTYTIQVSSSFGGVEGAFTLQLALGDVVSASTPTPTFTPVPQATTTGGGGATISVSSTLTTNEPSAYYGFNGSAGDVISVTLTSTDFDAYLILQDASGKVLTEDDDSGGNLNASISDFTLPGDGAFTVVATSNTRAAIGEFVITVSGAVLSPTTIIVTTPEIEATAVVQEEGTITLDTPVNGSLSDAAPSASYTYTASGADTITITLTSDDFDTYLSLQDASGKELTNDDDSAGNLNSRIENYTLPGSGTYTIEVVSAGGVTTGNFTLVVNAGGAVEPPVTPTPVPTVSPTEAPSGSTITVGQSVTGVLEGDQSSAVYTFEGEVGQHITIRLTSSDFDTYLLLSDSTLHLIASDDDGGGNLNALLEDVELPKNDSFVITVGSFDNTGRGTYTLSVEAPGSVQPTPEPTASPTSEPNGSTIIIGSNISGTLGTGQTTAAYTFHGEIGQTISISLVSSDFDSYVRLQDSSGHDLITDDDSGGGLDSRINVFTLPANDTYTIVVESYEDEYGSYTLSLSEAIIENIEYGQIVQGSVDNEGDTITYRFSGSADDVVSIRLTSPDFDTYLSLSDSSSSSLITNDDGGSSGTDSLIGPYTLSDDGDYYITVSSYDSTATGRFTLSFNKVTLTPLAFGDSVDVTFSSDVSAYYYQFDANNGDVINVTVDSGGSIDTALLLNGPDGYEVIFDADGGAGFEPEIFHQLLTESGSYILVLQAAVAGDSGSATFTLTKTVSPSLDDGPQQVRLSADITQDVVTFTGHEGEEVRLTATVTGGNATSPNLAVTQNGNEVASAYGTSVSGLSIQFTVPADGSVSVQLSDYSYNNVGYEVSLERISP